MNALLGLTWWGLLLVSAAGQVSASPSAVQQPSQWILADTKIDVTRAAEAFAAEVVPPATGTYWFKVRYSSPPRAFGWLPPEGSGLYGEPIHAAYGAQIKLRVARLPGGNPLRPKVAWSPMESGTKDNRSVADHIEFHLSKGVRYKVTLVVQRASPALEEFEPRFEIVMSHATRLNSSSWHGVLFLTPFLWLVGLAVLLITVRLGVRWLMARSQGSTGGRGKFFGPRGGWHW